MEFYPERAGLVIYVKLFALGCWFGLRLRLAQLATLFLRPR